MQWLIQPLKVRSFTPIVQMQTRGISYFAQCDVCAYNFQKDRPNTPFFLFGAIALWESVYPLLHVYGYMYRHVNCHATEAFNPTREKSCFTFPNSR